MNGLKKLRDVVYPVFEFREKKLNFEDSGR
jgi:hypothetical protein